MQSRRRIKMSSSDNIIVIKKYANRRLYNTSTSAYITLEDLAKLVQNGADVEVVDAKTGQDLTRQVLTQVVLEAESEAGSLLPLSFLKQLIGYYDHTLQNVLPHYLEASMDMFQKQRGSLEKATGGNANTFMPIKAMQNLEDIQRRNVQLAQQTFQLFNPFSYLAGAHTDPDAEISALTRQVEQLNAKIAELKASK